jgi:hypothetical protein
MANHGRFKDKNPNLLSVSIPYAIISFYLNIIENIIGIMFTTGAIKI